MTATTHRPTADITELLERLHSRRHQGHYYAALLGLRRYDASHLALQIERGLSYASYEKFVRNTSLSQRVVAELTEIPERTLARRKEAGRLEPAESDRLARLSRVFARAIELFEGEVERSRDWLLLPLEALGGRAPLEFARTDAGAIEVERLIGRLEHGIPV